MSAPKPEDLIALSQSRYNAAYAIEERTGRVSYNSAWKGRIRTNRDWYSGIWTRTTASGKKATAQPIVANLYQVAMDDISRLAAETTPSVRCDPMSAAQTEERRAQVREAIADTHWKAYQSELLTPQLAMDLIGTGFCALVSYPSDNYPYPAHLRLDPYNCYPDIMGNELQDLLYFSRQPLRKLARMYPNLGLNPSPMNSDWGEEMDYYGPEWTMKLIYAIKKDGTPNKPYVVDLVKNKIGRPWVSWAKVNTFDGEFRGMLDQIGPVLMKQNDLAGTVFDSAAKIVYGERLEIDVDNPEDEGPGAMLHGRQGSSITPVAPPPLTPAYFSLYEQLEEGARTAAAYPAARQGQVSQSIASASFVGSVMGQLTTAVRSVQGLLGSLRQMQVAIDFALDEAYLDFEKPLFTPKGGRKTYTPSKDIAGNYQNRVIYGFGAGLDKLNQGVHTIQIQSSGIISKAKAREEMEEVQDPAGEEIRIRAEQADDVMFQKLEAGGTLLDSITLSLGLHDGKSFTEILTEMKAQQEAIQAQQMQMQQAQAQGQPGPEPAGVTAEQQQTALQKGGIPGNAPNLQPGLTAAPLATPLPPLATVMTQNRPT